MTKNKPMPWIKLFTSRLHDVRMAPLNDRQQLLYYKLLMLAGQLIANGAFLLEGKELKVQQLAYMLRITDIRQLEKDINALKKARLLRANGHGPFIADWQDEQIDWAEKQNKDREYQAAHRARTVSPDTELTHTESGGSQRSRPRIQNQNQNKTKNQKEKKTTTNQPSSSKARKRGHSGGGGSEGDLFTDLAPGPKQTAQIMHPILTASGLGKEKSLNLLSKVAIRIAPATARDTALAALASVYEDETVRNKAITAHHRIEHNQIPREYYRRAKWLPLPDEILNAAGLERVAGRLREIEKESE